MKIFNVLFVLMLTACGGGYNEQGVPDRCAYVTTVVVTPTSGVDCVGYIKE